MQNIEEKTAREEELLQTLADLEDLAEKKTNIYSRLLTEPSFAQEMEELSKRHKGRKELLEKLAFGKSDEKTKADGVENTKGGENK